jgi:hypothetical protein
LLILILWGGVEHAPAQQPDPTAFRSAGSIPVDFVPGYLATGIDGRIAITSFNLDGTTPVSAYMVPNPTVEFSPLIFDSEAFPRGTGYSGVAIDASGAVFLTGDTGGADTCFIRKYRPDLRRDEVFGINGEIRPLVLRSLGCAVIQDRLFVASTWGTIAVFSSLTGQFDGMVSGDNVSQIRDLAAEPGAQQLFGVGQGALFWWSGGSAHNLGGYRFSRLNDPRYPGSKAEGLAYHSPLRTIYYVRRTPLEIRANNGTSDQRVFGMEDVTAISDLCDITFSPDYQVLYASDPGRRALHYAIYRGAVSPQVPYGGSVGGALSEPLSSGGSSPLSGETDLRTRLRSTQSEWYSTLSKIALEATAQNKRMGVYFRNERAQKCLELEASVLAAPALFQRYPSVLWAQIDVTKNGSLAEELGVFRVPTLLLIDESGEPIEQLEGDDISDDRIRRALNR